MRNKTITGHMVVKNEEKWIWYSIMSVIDFLDKLIIYDTGSEDRTVEIIKTIRLYKVYSEKIIFEEKGAVDAEQFYLFRQEQLDRTDTDYFFVIDGDEIWYSSALIEMKNLINAFNDVDLVASKFLNCAGDAFHYRDFSREKYHIKDIVGSITIRLYSMNIQGIHCAGDYGVEGYYDFEKKAVQSNHWNIYVLQNPYLHMSFLQRSGKIKGDLSIPYRKKKFRADWDHSFDQGFIYPDVFNLTRPSFVESPWKNRIGFTEKIIHFMRRIKKVVKKLLLG